MESLLTIQSIQVVDYDPEWPIQFRRFCDKIWPFVSDWALTIEHVGSTAVPGLAAKPVIDMDLVIPSRSELPEIVISLEASGYQHLGDLGIDDREAFRSAENLFPHHLYVCSSASIALRNHLTVRNHLRSHSSDAAAYSTLKKELAERFPADRTRYLEGKTEFILRILAQYSFTAQQLDLIGNANRHHAHSKCLL